jgi:aminopeptidase N
MPANNLTRDEARSRAELVEGVRYEVALDLTGDEKLFRSETTIRFRCRRRGDGIFLDLVAPFVEEIRLNGEPVPASAFDGVRVHLPPLAEDNEVRVVASCAYERTGVGLHRFQDPVDGAVYVHTQFESFDAHRVFACFDQPDVKATFDFSVEAPKGWEVSSNTSPLERPAPGAAGRWRFGTTKLMPPYITAVVGGPFHVVRARHGEIDLGLYCRASLAQHLDTEELFEVTKQGFDYFEDAFGYPYPFGDKYDQLFVPEFNAGAMENAGCVTFSEAYVFRSKVTDAERERRAETILHEMAHMWFGDLVTMRWWDDLWLNESFATFMSVISQARATRWRNSFVTFANAEKVWAYRQDQLPTTHPIAADCPDVESVETNFDGISYAKGASVLRQLVAWVGEEEFFKDIKTYVRRHEFGNADLALFLAALEESSGRDLHAWSKEWLETAGVNTLRPRFTLERGAYASFALVQEAPAEQPTLRSHRVAIGLYDEDGGGLVRRRRVELDVVGASTPVPALAGETVPVLLLVNDDDLTFAKIRFDESSLATLTQRLRDVRDPLARALCWTGTWDMVRDAELAAREWLRLVLANIDGETDITAVRQLLSQAQSAVLVFGEEANRDAALGSLAAAALDHVRAAPPGGDLQLAWARCFAQAATTADHHAILSGLLDGTESFDGLAVDTELRWLILRSLAADGLAGEAEIASELERDPTDIGSRHAAAARAARPTPEAKAEAWRAITEDPSPSFATIRATVGGFQQPGQRELLEPYAARYFDALPRIWSERELKVALEFAQDMYPGIVVGEETVRLTDAYLALEIPAPLRRLVIEGRDGMQRAMRARAVDAASA